MGNALLGGAVGGVNAFYVNLMFGEDATISSAILIGGLFSAIGSVVGGVTTSIVRSNAPTFVGGNSINPKIPILFQEYGRINPWPKRIGAVVEQGMNNAPSFLVRQPAKDDQ